MTTRVTCETLVVDQATDVTMTCGNRSELRLTMECAAGHTWQSSLCEAHARIAGGPMTFCRPCRDSGADLVRYQVLATEALS